MNLSGLVRCRPPRHGKFPGVSINNDGIIVEVHQPSMISSDINYQIGTIDGDEVLWSRATWMATGKFPKVAIDDNTCVVVREGRFLRQLYCHIGTLDGKRITWGGRGEKPLPICLGRLPAVALSGNRCVVTFDSAHIRYTTHYCLGDIQPNNTIIWSTTKGKLFGAGATETSVATNGNIILAAGRGWFSMVYAIGTFAEDRIDWRNQFSFDGLGYCSNICLDNDGYVIMTWQSLTIRQLSYTTGRVNNNVGRDNRENRSIHWNDKRNYDFGYNPTIALSSNNGQIVEEHETNFAPLRRCTLHCRVGKKVVGQLVGDVRRGIQEEAPAEQEMEVRV